jgi:DegV family protein with EDD domain
MGGVRVVTDSACDLSEELTRSLGVTVVPLTIRFGDEELVDRHDLSPDQFWQRCKAGGALPQTAAPSPGAFQRAYQQAADDGCDGVVCLTLSSGVSGTYQSACTAAESFGAVPVRVIDTRALTLGQGLLVLAAAEDAATGATVERIAEATTERAGRTRVLGVLGSLDHLQRGGRIGGAQALLGSILSIKPVVQLKDGLVAEESKQRTRARALEYMVDKVRAEGPLERLAVADGQAADIALVLDKLADVIVEHPMVVAELGPVVGTHAGPGTVGVCYLVAGPAPGGGR